MQTATALAEGSVERLTAPDPFDLNLSDRTDVDGNSWRRQRTLRARILASTRRFLAEEGARFTLRRVATDCGITVQTIRNSFGRRDELLVSAINDHTSAIWSVLDRHNRTPTVFLDLAEIYYQCAIRTPGFLAAVVTNAVGCLDDLGTLQRHGSVIKQAHLRRMLDRRQLSEGADCVALAAQITRLNTFMIYEWSNTHDARLLRDQMIEGNRMLLMGTVAPEWRSGLESWTAH